MATTKEQMNVQIATEIKQLAKTCATASHTNLNAWVEKAIRAQVARDSKKFNIHAHRAKVTKLVDTARATAAEQYLPGKVATREQMLAMARLIAAEDTTEGFTVMEIPPAPKRAAKSARSRSR